MASIKWHVFLVEGDTRRVLLCCSRVVALVWIGEWPSVRVYWCTSVLVYNCTSAHGRALGVRGGQAAGPTRIRRVQVEHDQPAAPRDDLEPWVTKRGRAAFIFRLFLVFLKIIPYLYVSCFVGIVSVNYLLKYLLIYLLIVLLMHHYLFIYFPLLMVDPFENQKILMLFFLVLQLGRLHTVTCIFAD
jgi:hypothetical protein